MKVKNFPSTVVLVAAMKSERISGSLAKTFWAMTKASTKRNEEIGLSEFMAMIDIELSSFVLVGFGCLDHSLAMPF